MKSCWVGFPGGPVVKNLPANEETQVRSLGWQYSLGKETQLITVFLPEKSPSQRSLAGYSPGCCKRVGQFTKRQSMRAGGGEPLIQFCWYLYKKNATWQDKCAHGRGPCEDEGRDGGETGISPGITDSQPPEARREPWLRFSLTAFRRYQPWHLDLRLAASRTV